MANGAGEVDVPVFGIIYSRPAGNMTAEWQPVIDTPGRFTPKPGEDYQFAFMGIPDVRDPDLERLVDSLAGVQSVKEIGLGGCKVTARSVRRLAELPWLESLNAFCMTDEGMASVAKLKDLRRLDLDSSDVTDRGVAKLAGLSRLESLSLRACSITDAGIEHLLQLPLAQVELGGCRALTDRAICALATMPNLHSLGLVGCWRLTDRAIAALAQMPKLTTLNLCRSGGFLIRLLRKLGVPGNSDIGSFSASAVERLLEAHPNCDLWQPIDWSAIPE